VKFARIARIARFARTERLSIIIAEATKVAMLGRVTFYKILD